MTEVRTGDRVRIQPPAVEGVVDDHPVEGAALVIVTADGRRVAFDDRHTVEVLERAQMRPGTVKRSRKGQVVVLTDDSRDTMRWVLVVGCNPTYADWFSDAEIEDWPTIGVAPGTPAAEAQGSRPLDHDGYRRELAEALFQDPVPHWEELVFTARRYASHARRDEASSEHAHQSDGHARPPLHVDNEAIVQGQYYAEKTRAREFKVNACRVAVPAREARWFPTDGPEPPADVTALVDEGDGRRPYLLRRDGDWVWSSSLYEVIADDTKPRPWRSRAVQANADQLREVIP